MLVDQTVKELKSHYRHLLESHSYTHTMSQLKNSVLMEYLISGNKVDVNIDLTNSIIFLYVNKSLVYSTKKVFSEVYDDNEDVAIMIKDVISCYIKGYAEYRDDYIKSIIES